jgi:PAS domain S-box-containing protein
MIKLLVIEDHPSMISGLECLLKGDVEVTFSSNDMDNALNFDHTKFDIILLDLLLPETNPINNVKRLKEIYPNPIVIFTCEDSNLWKKKMFDIGVMGYLIKTSNKEKIVTTLHQVLKEFKRDKELQYPNLKICNLDFFNFLDDMFFVLDLKGNIIEYNTSVTRKLRYLKEDLIGKNIQKFFNSDVSSIFTGEYSNKRIPILNSDGNSLFVEIRSLKIHARCSLEDYLLIVAKDIEAEEKYKNIFDNSTQGIFQSTMDGKYITVNPAFAQLCGYESPEELSTSVKNISDQIYANKSDRDQFLDTLLKYGKVKNAEGQIKRKDGDKIWVSCSAKLIKNKDGTPLYIDGIIDNITDKKDTIENYISLLKAIPDMMVRVRKDGLIMDIKPGEGTYSELGQSTHYIGGNIGNLPFGDVITTKFKNIIKEVIEKEEPIEFCYAIFIKGIERNYYSRTVKNGESEVIVIVREITEEINIRNDLTYSRDYSENIINTANAMIIELDNSGNIITFNKAAEEVTGYKKEELFGKNWFETLCPKDRFPHVWEEFNGLMKQKIEAKDFENPILTKSGEERYIVWKNNEVKSNNKVVGVISFGLDITEMKKTSEELKIAKEKAEQSDKMKLEYLSNMSHDLRTPMNAIIGFTDLLRANNLTKNEKHDYINTIINNGKYLMALIDDIIDISKIDAGSLKVENRDFEINKLMEELRLSYIKQIKDKNIEIIIDIDVNKNIIIQSDKYRLRQIMANLIGNAIKFTNDGYVKFGYKILNNRMLEIYVEDTGPGIEKQNQKIIFERFKQLNDTNKYKGAGLGLSISKSLVELLGFKEIKLVSEFGNGSRFYFNVPYDVKNFTYMSDIKERKHKKINFAGKNILLVEDNRDSRTIMKSYLQDTKANVIEMKDGIGILDVIKEKEIDLVLLDIGLPGGKNGYVILEEIKNYDNRLPVIIESALAMPDQKNKAYDLGCDDFISKPFNREDFLNKIDNLL